MKLVETSPGTYRLDHKRGDHDDRAIALALVAHALTDTPQRGTMRFRPLRRPDAHPFVESPQPIHASPPTAEPQPTRCPCGGDARTWQRNALGSWALASGSHHHIDPGRAPHSANCRCSSHLCEGATATAKEQTRRRRGGPL